MNQELELKGEPGALKENAVQAHRHLELTTIHAARWQQYGELNPQVTEGDDRKAFLTQAYATNSLTNCNVVK